ncbi:MAG TPA: hypothetical protein VG826_25465 [Pirellulales bacterium]|nr:hypothetical protein [Pirellulales bacterium]
MPGTITITDDKQEKVFAVGVPARAGYYLSNRGPNVVRVLARAGPRPTQIQIAPGETVVVYSISDYTDFTAIMVNPGEQAQIDFEAV